MLIKKKQYIKLWQWFPFQFGSGRKSWASHWTVCRQSVVSGQFYCASWMCLHLCLWKKHFQKCQLGHWWVHFPKRRPFISLNKLPFYLLKFLFHVFQLYVLMGHSINMSSLMMETVIGRLLMCTLTSVMMMISKHEVCVYCVMCVNFIKLQF